MSAQAMEFDPDQLRKKYRVERDKRLREEGNDQYLEVIGEFANYVDDPYVEPGFSREPITDLTDVVVIGGGFGGLLAGARLREAGIKSLGLIDKAGDFGGTWYWNRYPGAACDVESYIYLPLLEELNFVPKEKYTHAPEILAHSRAIGEKFDLYENACFQTEVTALEWVEADSHWLIRTNRNDEMKARFVVMSNGPLSRPKLPGIEGVGLFKGHTFHTSRWDYDYTGGSSEGNLTGLANKRVGIIGTGATAVQCVPHLGAGAKSLHVFQRTPSSIDVRDNRPTDEDWAAALEPGWQKRRMENFNTLVSGGYQDEDLVQDGWTEIIRNLATMVNFHDKEIDMAEIAQKMELADFQKMEQVRARAESIVADPSTAEALKPYYRQFCKRPCFHDNYLQTFNRSSVTLVNTDGRGVDRITEKGVVVDGEEYELDCLIFATGFEVGTDYTRRSGYDLKGVDGLSLKEKWDDGFASLHGMHINGFPNCFVVGQAQSGFTVNFPHAMDEQAKHIAYLVDQCIGGNLGRVEATPEAEQSWVETIVGLARLNEDYQAQCTPGYYNAEGKPNPKSVRSAPYGAGSDAFFKLLEDWRAAGTLDGLTLGSASTGE